MKDIYKNPLFYYIAVPLAAALWPLVVFSLSLPKSQKDFLSEQAQYEKAQAVITEILTLDPDRLQFADAKGGSAEFDYAIAVEIIASRCGIRTTNYKLSSGIVMKQKGEKSQRATVILKDVGIEDFAKFLSMIQLRYPSLQCSQLKKLQKKKGKKDAWDVDLDFKYYY